MDKQVYQHISQQTKDPIVERKTCAVSGTEFAVFQSDLDFYSKISPTFDGVKFPIPTPTLCPEERQRRRLAFRNERKLYKRSCDATGKQIISTYSPDKPYIVYDQKNRRSDSRDPMDYGRDFDFTRTFSENFRELMVVVPRAAIMNDNGVGSENCEYCQDFAFGKNCYMCTGSRYLENCYYCSIEVINSKYLVDCNVIDQSEHCYQCFCWSHLYNCQYVYCSRNNSNCFAGYNLNGCKDCISCTNLDNAQYYYRNKQYTPQEYQDIIKHIDYQSELDYFHRLLAEEKLLKNTYHINAVDSFGNYIFNAQNVIFWDYIHNSKDCKYVFGGDQLQSCYDITVSWWPELCIESVTPDNWFQVNFSTFTWKSQHCYYTDICQSSQHLFGCIGLRNKSYCIFNKQYTKEEYEKTVAKIITHMQETWEWGEFFHPSLSPFGYNETVAMEYYPDDQASITTQWYHRSEYQAPRPTSDKVIQWSDLPATIQEVDDVVLQSTIACVATGELFRIQSQELAFYRKHNIPLPRKHPDQRHLERLQLRK
jgi:hypothetical protein